MQPFQQRVVDEKKALDDKINDLDAFWSSPIFPTLPEAERGRLEKQFNIMVEYSAVLGDRIAAFAS
jgi:hypothetical protein